MRIASVGLPLALLLLLGVGAASAEIPVHTFSIVARDSVTGDLGVAVQSHYFAVGPVVADASAGMTSAAVVRTSSPRVFASVTACAAQLCIASYLDR